MNPEAKKRIPAVRAFAAFVLALLMLFSCVSCKLTDAIFGADGTTGPEESGLSPSSGTAAPDVTAGPAESTSDETAVTPDGTDTQAAEESTGSEETTQDTRILYQNPLSGLMEETDRSRVRPVSVIIDNLSSASPQNGLAGSEIIIECMAEGGISRLIAITNSYESNSIFGPVRSTRDYMVSLCQAFGTLMVGAGYSPTGYTAISENNLDYIDGTHDRYALSGFYRDVQRYNSSGYEHSLMITGNGIRALATLHNYPLTVQSQSNAFDFAPDGSQVILTGGDASHAVLTYSVFQQVQLIYSRKENAYYRYQYGTKAHLDAGTGDQLNFTNIFILFADQHVIAGDTEGRLSVGVTGNGTGYYLTGGKYIPVEWSRADNLSAFTFTSGGASFKVSCGKTLISVVDSSLKNTSSVVLNYKVQ